MKIQFDSTPLDNLFGFQCEPIIEEIEFQCENVGGPMTEDMKKQISETMTGRKRGKYKPRTKPCSEETKRKRSEAAKRNNSAARLQTPKAREKMASTKRKQTKPRDSSGRFINTNVGL